ncbi:MAG: hypothetical protein ACKVOM_04060 [Ferruginibacter sp.]
MKKLLLSSLVALSILGTGCLKDKDYEDQKYGIQNTEVKGIGFVQSNVIVALLANATPQTITSAQVGLSANDVPKAGMNYTVVASPSLIPAGTTLLPSSAYTFKASNSVPAGTYNAPFEIVVPNASLLNSNLSYGVAFTITSADNGYIVAENSKVVAFTINVKNIYDGIYSVVSGNVTRYTAPGVVENPSTLNGSLAGNPDVILSTSGPSSVAIPIAGQAGGLRWGNGSGSFVAGVDGITLTVNQTSNLVSSVSAANATFGNWVGRPNYYDPATKTFYLAFRWNPTANVREYEIVLKYKGPRP